MILSSPLGSSFRQGQHNPSAGHQTMPIYHGGAGFIFRPGHTPIKCGKGGDSGGRAMLKPPRPEALRGRHADQMNPRLPSTFARRLSLTVA